jgi:hypothetical protein
MRAEALHFLAYGAVLFALVMLFTRNLAQPRLKPIVRAASFALVLGIGVFPGHGEAIVVPVSTLLAKGGMLAIAGGVFALVWFAVGLLLFRTKSFKA